MKMTCGVIFDATNVLNGDTSGLKKLNRGSQYLGLNFAGGLT